MANKSLHKRIEELRKAIPKRNIELVKVDEDTVVKVEESEDEAE